MIDQNIVYLYATVVFIRDINYNPINKVGEIMMYLEPNTNMREFGSIRYTTGTMYVGKATDFESPVLL